MRILPPMIAVGFLLASTAAVHAQYGYSTGMGGSRGATPTGSSGMFGSRSVGSGGVQAGNRSFAGGQSMQEQVGASAGQLTGNERYVRGNRQPGQFVGSDAGDAAFVGSAGAGAGGAFGQAGALGGGLGMGMGMGTGLGGMSQFGRQGMGFGMSQFGQSPFGRTNQRTQRGNNTGRNTQTVRTTLELGFTPPAASPTETSQRISGVLQRSERLQVVSPIQVQMVGRTAVLRGTVASQADRDLAQRVVLLEPGISQVQNDLVVAGQTDEELPAPGR